MSNWLFLMLLYGFFGWMKKRQRDKARDKIQSQDDWDTGGIVDFGEGILEAIMGDENSGVEKPETILKEDIDEEEYLDDFEEVLVESPKIEPEIDLIVDETPGKDVPLQSNNVRNVNINNTKKIRQIMRFFWIFELFFNASRRNFYKRLFSRHNNLTLEIHWTSQKVIGFDKNERTIKIVQKHFCRGCCSTFSCSL